MTRWLRTAIAAVSALAAVGAGIAAVGSGRIHAVYTDGRGLSAPARTAPVREILWKPAEPLDNAINTDADEYEPRLSADGTLMVFVRGRPGANADLYESRWSASGWAEPAPLTSVNTPADELGPELSADGRSLYFYTDGRAGLGGFDLWVARMSEAGAWSEPVNLGPGVNSPFNEYGPALAPEGDVLYFSSNRPRAGESAYAAEGWPATLREVRQRHDYDLFMAPLSQAGPGDARPVPELNTSADEGAPAVSPAGDFLYFASDRAGGTGGFDLYRARRSFGASGPGEPSHGRAESLGDLVNSRFNDLDPALSADGFRLTFASDRPRGDPGPESTGDYGLWFTASREVYLQRDPAAGPAWASAWERLWPWLLLLLSSLAAAALLARFARRSGWAGGGKLGLLARCLIFSFAVHLVVASLLAVWRVGSTIGELIREGGSPGGGSRVTLASSGLTSAEAIGLQVRANLGDLPELSPGMNVESRPDAPRPEIRAQLAAITPDFSRESPDRARAAPDLPLLSASEVSGRPVASPEPPATSEQAALPPQLSPDAAIGEAEPAIPSPASPLMLPAFSAPEIAGLEAASLPPPPAGPRVDAAAKAVPVFAASGDAAQAPVKTGPRLAAPGLDADLAALPSDTAPIATNSEAGPAAAISTLPLPGAAPRADVNVPAQIGRAGPVQTLALPPQDARALDPGPLSRGIDPAPSPGQTAARASTALPGSDFNPGEIGLPADLTGSAGRSSTRPEAHVQLPLALPGPESPGRPAVADPAAREGGAGRIDVPLARDHGAADAAHDSAPRVGFDAPASSPAAAERASGPGPALLGSLPPARDDVGLPDVPADEPAPTPVETFAQRDPSPAVRGEILEKMGGTRETERAVTLALTWLAAHQEPDGRWSGTRFDDQCGRCGGAAEIDSDTAITGLALLCYLGAGHTHLAEGEHREAVARALRWLLAREAGRGDLRGDETMYAQTIATVALCEALAMTGDPALAGPARRAVAFVMDTSSRDGRSARDTSVLGWQVMAVESARRAGIPVSGATFNAADRYLDHVADRASPGRYADSPDGRPTPAMTAEAMFVRQLTGHGRGEARMNESARFILGAPPRWNAGAPTYYWYYATLALFQQQGEAWTQWNSALIPELLSNQHQGGNAAGSWDPQDEWSRLGGRIYQTAICTLSLEVYYRYRPAGLQSRP